jgi:hypothetical protein
MKRISATILLTFGLMLGSILWLAGPAGASTKADCYSMTTSTTTTTGTVPPGGCTAPGHHTTTPSHTPASSGATGTKITHPAVVVDTQPAASGQLAFTGIDIAGVVFVGLALVAGGLLLVRLTRRRRLS